MIDSPNPSSPAPARTPSSLWVNPNWLPQSLRIAPRTANPIPAAIRVKKLAQKRILWFRLGPEPRSRGGVAALTGRSGGGRGRVGNRVRESVTADPGGVQR